MHRNKQNNKLIMKHAQRFTKHYNNNETWKYNSNETWI